MKTLASPILAMDFSVFAMDQDSPAIARIPAPSVQTAQLMMKARVCPIRAVMLSVYVATHSTLATALAQALMARTALKTLNVQKTITFVKTELCVLPSTSKWRVIAVGRDFLAQTARWMWMSV